VFSCKCLWLRSATAEVEVVLRWYTGDHRRLVSVDTREPRCEDT